jgi:hypothetical protein
MNRRAGGSRRRPNWPVSRRIGNSDFECGFPLPYYRDFSAAVKDHGAKANSGILLRGLRGFA